MSCADQGSIDEAGADSEADEVAMACCVFAAFLLMQLLAPFRWIRQRLSGTREPTPDPAVAWSLALPGPGANRRVDSTSVQRPRSPLRRAFVVVFGLEVLVLIALAGSLRTPPGAAESGWAEEQIWYEALHDSWCRTLGLR